MKKKIAGLIVAAGMSSRMKDFKPLMKVAGKPIIQHSIENLRAGGAQKILIVTGNRADDLQPLLKKLSVSSIRNINYSTTDMFTSVKLGLAQLVNNYDAVFLLPGDVPLFMPYSLQAMIKLLDQSNNIAWVQPCYKGQGGHPVLINAACLEQILCYKGEDGLKGALTSCKGQRTDIDLPDRGILLDADTPEDYQKLCDYAQVREIPDIDICMEIYKLFKVPQKTIDHCMAVAQMAQEIADQLAEAGYALDHRLVQAGAMLHDVAKGQKHHELIGAKWLGDLGCLPVARVVGAHMDLPDDAINNPDERAIVYLADKYVKGRTRVSIEQRFQEALDRWQNDEAVNAAILKRMDKTKQLQKRVYELIHNNKNK
ncbi:MAG: DVU_1551 family NTP transferase [Bacillota bacterium]|jgi:molybdenum cofactor cytidylyltransferase